MVDGLLLGYVLRAAGGRSGDLCTADYEDLQSSPARQVREQMSKHQEVKTPHCFRCADGRIRLFDSPPPSSLAQGNLEQEEEGV